MLNNYQFYNIIAIYKKKIVINRHIISAAAGPYPPTKNQILNPINIYTHAPPSTTSRRRFPPCNYPGFLHVWSFQFLSVPSTTHFCLNRVSANHRFISRSVFSSPYTFSSARYDSSPNKLLPLQWNRQSLVHSMTTVLHR